MARLAIIEGDSWLEPVEEQIVERHERYRAALRGIEKSSGSLADFANAHLFFGFHYDPVKKGWWFRDWLPRAYDVYLFGDFNNWARTQLRLTKESGGVWSIFLPDEEFGGLVHGSRVKLHVHGENGWGDHIPAYIRRTVQDEHTKDFSGQLWAPPVPFDWEGDRFDIRSLGPLLIYESHIGMAQEKEGVGTCDEFRANILPRIKKQGYNTIQLMAVAEHPYYGSFGYHVSNFYAPSSRFGTPEELKLLVKEAHKMGLAVVMDLVHAHYVKNTNEGLNELDGSDSLYSPPGEAGYQKYWDSKLFDYGRQEVKHFLLSNLKYWLEEFHFDGFRFDGVTSMIYTHHGYTDFERREQFFDHTINLDAVTYLTLANKLVHELRPGAVTIAEDVSGMPGMCIGIDAGGVGFDYRLAMAIPDFWIELLEDVPDEDWDIHRMWHEMTNRLPAVGTIAYCESHDQAMVGDKTIAFRLMDKEMYTCMNRTCKSVVIDRGMALHKMIRSFTIALGGQGYLNFMGNEFGHPEWIDFPREGNGWSYAHAQRRWSLAENGFLRYGYLNDFDRAMIDFVRENKILEMGYAYNRLMDEKNKTIVFNHDSFVFVFNWHPSASIPDYVVPMPCPGKYRVALNSDDKRFGGFGRLDPAAEYFTYDSTCNGETRQFMKVYNINRAAVVFELMELP